MFTNVTGCCFDASYTDLSNIGIALALGKLEHLPDAAPGTWHHDVGELMRPHYV